MKQAIEILTILLFGITSTQSFADTVPLTGFFGMDILILEQCQDNDGDGFGNPANSLCEYPELDCDDNEALANPGLIESKDIGNCGDGIDNDCDGLADTTDPDCPDSCFIVLMM